MKRPNRRKVILLRLIKRKSCRNTGWHGFGVFDKAVSSWFDNVSEEHGLTEDGKTVPPFLRIFRVIPVSTRSNRRHEVWLLRRQPSVCAR